jgi:hypothetical protein
VRLTQETLFGVAIPVQLSPQDFEGQVATQAIVAAVVHFAHAAHANQLE